MDVLTEINQMSLLSPFFSSPYTPQIKLILEFFGVNFHVDNLKHVSCVCLCLYIYFFLLNRAET